MLDWQIVFIKVGKPHFEKSKWMYLKQYNFIILTISLKSVCTFNDALNIIMHSKMRLHYANRHKGLLKTYLYV